MLLLKLSIASILITRLTGFTGYRLGLTDSPDARKFHQGSVPLTGGIAIFLTTLLGVVALDIAPLTYPMLGIAVMVFAVGVFDDIQHINPWLRLAIQYGAGLLLATYGGIAIYQVGNLLGLGNIPLLLLSAPLTALAVAGLSNAYNMIDGIDGLAAATIALPLAVLYMLALQAGHPQAGFLLLILVPLAVFLVFNLGPDNRFLPRIFLGDNGSITLGFLVTAALVYFAQGEQAVIRPVTALWLVTLPLMDMLATMLRRARQGRKLMEADRSHLHHTLVSMGLSTRQTLVLLLCYATTCALIGLALELLPEYLSLACYFGLFMGHCLFVINAEALGRLLRPQTGHTGASAEEFPEVN